MTAGIHLEFNGEIDRYEEHSNDVFAHIRFWKEDEITKGGAIDYPHQLIPQKGSFSAARFDVSIFIASEQRGIVREVIPDSTVNEVKAELVDTNGEGWRFSIQETSGGSFLGQLWLHPDYVPSWLNDEGDQRFMTIKLEYDHKRTKEETNYSEAEIENIRGEGRQISDEDGVRK